MVIYPTSLVKFLVLKTYDMLEALHLLIAFMKSLLIYRHPSLPDESILHFSRARPPELAHSFDTSAV